MITKRLTVTIFDESTIVAEFENEFSFHPQRLREGDREANTLQSYSDLRSLAEGSEPGTKFDLPVLEKFETRDVGPCFEYRRIRKAGTWTTIYKDSDMVCGKSIAEWKTLPRGTYYEPYDPS